MTKLHAFALAAMVAATPFAAGANGTDDKELLLQQSCANYLLEGESCTEESLLERMKSVEDSLDQSQNLNCGECTTTDIFKPCGFNCPGYYYTTPWGRICGTIGC